MPEMQETILTIIVTIMVLIVLGVFTWKCVRPSDKLQIVMVYEYECTSCHSTLIMHEFATLCPECGTPTIKLNTMRELDLDTITALWEHVVELQTRIATLEKLWDIKKPGKGNGGTEIN